MSTVQQMEISRQRPIIEIRTIPAKLNIQRVGRPQFRIRHKPPEMRIHHRLPTMQIDRSQRNAMLDRMSIFRRTEQYAAQSVQIGLESIGKIAEEGNRMAAIYQRHNSISQIIADRVKAPVQLTAQALPSAQINWDPGQMEIEWTPGEFSLEWIMDKMIEMQYEPGRVEINMIQYPYIKIEFTPRDKPRFEPQIPRRVNKLDRTL
jgi:hypothetical protein